MNYEEDKAREALAEAMDRVIRAGWTPSQVAREALRALAAKHQEEAQRALNEVEKL